MRFIPLIIVPLVFIFAIVLLGKIGVLAALEPYNPFSGYYGVNPPDDSWKSCKGFFPVTNGSEVIYKTSDNTKRLQYWITKANRENNINLCQNVGYEEAQTDYQYMGLSKHKQAVMTCEYIFEKNHKYTDCTK